jgi:hypothetical protein
MEMGSPVMANPGMMGRARARGRGRGRGRTMRGGSDCTTCSSQPAAFGGQTGGKMSVLNPESLGGGTFDRSGGALANQAFGQYLSGSQKLSNLASSGANAMMGGKRRSKGRSAKKYSRKSRSKSRSKSRRSKSRRSKH